MANDKITMQEKENPPRIKEEYSTLSITITCDDPDVIIAPAAQKPAALKFTKPLVEKIEGPFDENHELVHEMEVDKTYIFKATKFKESTFTPIKHIWFAEQLDDGEILDLEYKKGENPYLDKDDAVCYSYKAKDAKKIRIYAYVAKPIEEVSILSNIGFVDDYVIAIRDGKIVYTCNSGWIDKTHAFTDTKRTEFYIGVKNLWNQILNETGIKSNSPNDKGFKVTYRQDATLIQNLPLINKPVRLGNTKSYFVKSNLTVQEKEQVALAIFQEVSIAFESFQAFGAVIGKGDSSFEPADLISNLISFYRIVKPELTEKVILNLSKELTAEQSVNVYRKYPGTFSDEKYKNRVFKPKYFPNEHCDGQPVFPKELNSIKPASKNSIFRDWMPIFDIHAGKPPISGSNKL